MAAFEISEIMRGRPYSHAHEWPCKCIKGRFSTTRLEDDVVDKSTVDFFIDINEITKGGGEGFYF
jgi:hypothetical protein